jgi:excisionase family DNA binding protein
MKAAIGRITVDGLMSVGEAAKLAWISRDCIDHLIHQGKLHSYRDSAGRRVINPYDATVIKSKVHAALFAEAAK